MLPFSLTMALVSRNRSQIQNKNFGELLFLCNPDSKSLARILEKVLRKKVHSKYGVLFNETCIKESLLPIYTVIYIYIYIYINTYVYLYINSSIMLVLYLLRIPIVWTTSQPDNTNLHRFSRENVSLSLLRVLQWTIRKKRKSFAVIIFIRGYSKSCDEPRCCFPTIDTI